MPVSAGTLELLKAETARAERLHGPLTRDPLRALGIALEELGEVAEAVLTLTRRGTMEGGRRVARAHLRDELLQVASVALLMVDNLNKEGP